MIDAQDDESRRYVGDVIDEKVACIEVGGTMVGWVDYDLGPAWLLPGEVNMGYSVFPQHRGNGYTSRGSPADATPRRRR